MKSTTTLPLGNRCRTALLAALVPGLVLACVAGCHKPKTEGENPADAEVAAAAAPDAEPAAAADTEAGTEVTPPAAVVPGDPSIPLNEAVVGAAPVAADYSADVAPPAPVVEDQPPAPEPGETWIPGYWWWSIPFHRYVWVSGAWRHPPPDQYWSAGSWGLVSGRYMWTPGYWGPRGYAREMIGVPPPPYRLEAYGAAPGEGFLWTPGYYAWRGGSYEWIGGSWLRPPGVGYGWIEPRYVSVGGRYFLQPGRWDFAPARRGVVYRPDINIRAGGHLSPAPVPHELVAAHANFVAASSRAVAQGATRTPGGGYSAHGGGGAPAGGVEAHGGGGAPAGGAEAHGGGAPPVHGLEAHGGGNVGVETAHAAPMGGNQPHGAPPGHVEPHDVHLNVAPVHVVPVVNNPPPSHGPPPGKKH
jgi:hypothetical protein